MALGGNLIARTEYINNLPASSSIQVSWALLQLEQLHTNTVLDVKGGSRPRRLAPACAPLTRRRRHSPAHLHSSHTTPTMSNNMKAYLASKYVC